MTGAARRIGRAIALELGTNGFDVAVHYRKSKEQANSVVAELHALGARSTEFRADLSTETECDLLVPAVIERFGSLDAIVNNASIFEQDSVETFSYAAMDRHWRTNTGPAVLLARRLCAHLTSRNALGCVINLLDQKLWNENPDHLSYTLSKAALQAATIALAHALSPTVRVCGVAPGVTLPSGPMSDEEFDHAHRLTPLKRSSRPADIAGAVRFLLGATAITGTTLLVDGGQHLSGQGRDVLYLTSRRT